MDLPERFILARCPDYADLSPRSKIRQEILLGIDYQDSTSNMAGVSDTLDSTTGRNEIRPTAVNNPSITGAPLSNLLIEGGQADAGEWLDTIFRMAADLVESEKQPHETK